MSALELLPFAFRLALAGASCLVSAAAVASEPAPEPAKSPGDAVACADAARAVERARAFPLAVLRAVAIAESGRWRGGRQGEQQARIAWPWTVTAEGEGRYFATKAAAIGHVRALRRDGVRSIDVGCMQINLMHHPGAFASLDEAFDPGLNVAYAGDFLTRLYESSRSWSRAVAFYHSGTPGKGLAYWRRVEKLWNAERARLFDQARRARIQGFRERRAARLGRGR